MGTDDSKEKDWASRFKRSSLEKSRRSGGQGSGRVSDDDLLAAKLLDPTGYLISRGYCVKREGRHLSARLGGEECYRLTRKDDGRYLWCPKQGKGGGDNISLVKEIEPGVGFVDAVSTLLGGLNVRKVLVTAERSREDDKRTPPRLPWEGPGDRIEGRDYLRGRGIGLETLEHAEGCGMLRYSKGGVLFVGYDPEGGVRSISRRAISPDDSIQKRDLKGSDKSFPALLPGDSSKVWIVEGGADALALHELARQQGEELPTVIVSGGANVGSFFSRPALQLLLKAATRVTVVGENEKTPEIQAKVDALHLRQCERVFEITGRQAVYWTPRPEQGKDLADLNFRRFVKTTADNCKK